MMPNTPFSDRHLHLEDLLGLLPWIPAGPVVDIGCGQGHFSAAMAAYGLPVTALDVDASALGAARKAYGGQIDWLHEDIRAHRLNRESQAAIVCLNVFPYIPHGERARLIGRLKAAVKPGGLLILTGYTLLDPSAQLRLATSINRLDQRPTGVLALGELHERLREWQVLFAFEGWAFEGSAPEERGPDVVAGRHMSQIVARKPETAKKEPFSAHPFSTLGVGSAWHRSWSPQLKTAQGPHYVELQLEDWLDPAEDRALLQLLQSTPVLFRARGLGTALDSALPDLLRLLARTQSPFWVVSLGLWRLQSGLTLPLPPSPRVWDAVLAQLLQIRALVSCPFLLENSVASLSLGLAESELLNRLTENCDCGLSLDLNQLCQFGALQGFEPVEWLRALAPERIMALRLPADTGSPVYAEAWRLARQVLRQSPIRALSVVTAPDEWALAAQLEQAQHWLMEAHL